MLHQSIERSVFCLYLPPAQFFVMRDEQQFGPYTPEQIREYLATGNLVATDMAWREGADHWFPITDYELWI